MRDRAQTSAPTVLGARRHARRHVPALGGPDTGRKPRSPARVLARIGYVAFADALAEEMRDECPLPFQALCQPSMLCGARDLTELEHQASVIGVHLPVGVIVAQALGEVVGLES